MSKQLYGQRTRGVLEEQPTGRMEAAWGKAPAGAYDLPRTPRLFLPPTQKRKQCHMFSPSGRPPKSTSESRHSPPIAVSRSTSSSPQPLDTSSSSQNPSVGTGNAALSSMLRLYSGDREPLREQSPPELHPAKLAKLAYQLMPSSLAMVQHLTGSPQELANRAASLASAAASAYVSQVAKMGATYDPVTEEVDEQELAQILREVCH